MERLAGARQRYDWGSTTAVFDFLGQEPDGQPWAELWLGAHPNGPTHLVDASGDASPTTLEQLVAAEPQRLLGADVVRRNGHGYDRGIVQTVRLDDVYDHGRIDRSGVNAHTDALLAVITSAKETVETVPYALSSHTAGTR